MKVLEIKWYFLLKVSDQKQVGGDFYIHLIKSLAIVVTGHQSKRIWTIQLKSVRSFIVPYSFQPWKPALSTQRVSWLEIRKQYLLTRGVQEIIHGCSLRIQKVIISIPKYSHLLTVLSSLCNMVQEAYWVTFCRI